MLNLGEDLEEKDFTAGAEKLAKYLYRGTVTPAAALLDKCRACPPQNQQSAGINPAVRIFGFAQAGFSDDDIPLTTIAELSKAR